MAARPGVEGEARLMEAVAMVVRRAVESRLPKHQRGIHAPRLDATRLVGDVRAVLADLVEDLAAEVMEAAPAPPPPTVPVGFNGREGVMDNEHPCTVCTEVSRVAVHEYEDGMLVRVECEQHAQEFRHKGGP